MKQEDKKLLLKDLCSRLPYGIKAYVKSWSKFERRWIEDIYVVKSVYPSLNNIFVSSNLGSIEVILGYDDYNIKPYLFPLSSMTEEQYYELQNCSSDDCLEHMELVKTLRECTDFTHWPLYEYRVIDWLNKNHFDYRGLIPMGLAIDCTNLNIY